MQVFPDAILKLNKKGMSPLHVAIEASRYDSVVLLFKECMELCPKALEPNDQGECARNYCVALYPGLPVFFNIYTQETSGRPALKNMGRLRCEASAKPPYYA